MSLRSQVLDGLDAAGSITPGAPQTISWPTPDGPLKAHVTSLDRVGVAFDDLTLAAASLANASIDRLKLIASKLAAKLTYLLEDVGPTEIDFDGATVQLRSKTPYRDGDRGRTTKSSCVARASRSIVTSSFTRRPAARGRRWK